MKWIPIITNENDWIFISFIAILGIIAFPAYQKPILP